ncbi:hypothetical protein [Fibrella rubiginis]|uniref:hypothetical protein n=1 Tax=Fibrella rubiginis TaxID=2817060 RepID=UPI001E491DA4|nr:hypothetical protein [Fibrella rubiginis]
MRQVHIKPCWSRKFSPSVVRPRFTIYNGLSELRTQNLRMLTAPECYAQLLSDFLNIFGRVPLKYIASHLGISPETFSRLRARRTV